MLKRFIINKKFLTTFLLFIILLSLNTLISFATDNETIYTITNDWGGGTSINIEIINNNDFDLEDWELQWNFPEDQSISAFWGADYSQTGTSVAVTPSSWTTTILANSSTSFGFMASYSDTNSIPEEFTLNASAFGITDFVDGNTTNTNSIISQYVWTSSDRWANLTTDGYTLYNNIWGSETGSQTIWARSFNDWGVTADFPNTGGIKSYPNCEMVVDTKLTDLNSCTSSFECTVPDEGAYNTAYDIWCDNHAYEIMLWMNWEGDVGPIASGWEDDGTPIAEYTDLEIGGISWNVYKGTNGVNQVYSFLKTEETNSATVDIKAVCDWIQDEGWYNDVTLNKVQLGWEITSSDGGLDFQMNDYSVDFD
jgi:hypothetical protein